MALETRIRSTESLKSKGVDFWDNLKARNLVFADRLASFDTRLSKRVETCADTIKFKECANGFLAFKSARFCRVRGCPVCEWRRSRRVAKVVANAVSKLKLRPTDYWQLLTVSVDPVPVETLSSVIDDLGDAFQRLVSLKAWRIKGGFRFIHLQWIDDKVKPSIKFLALCPPSTRGRNYISINKWTQMWRQSLRVKRVPKVEVKNFGSIPFEYVAQRSKHLAWRSLNFEVCPDSVFPVAFQQIHRRKTITAMGCFKSIFVEEREPRRKYYPSERAAIWSMRSRYFGYLPNPDKDEHSDQFLTLPEFCWDAELLAELEQADN